MKSVLILGGGGFLATYIARHYMQRGWRVISVGNGAGFGLGHVRHSWRLPHPDLAHLLAIEQPTLCVNAAGRASVAASMVEPLADFEASPMLVFNVLDDLRRQSPRTVFINLSSAAVYGSPGGLPIEESGVVAPISPYGWHKRLSELLLEEYARIFAIRSASLRIFSAYGLGLQRQVVWDLLVRAREDSSGPLVLRGMPEDSRDFVHASDVARAVQTVATGGKLEGEAYNVAGGNEVQISNLAQLVLRIVESRRKIVFDNARLSGYPSRWHADIARIHQLGFEPSVRLEDGIREIATHFQSPPSLAAN